MVRLKASDGEGIKPLSHEFQFQYGAIKGKTPTIMTINLLDFNSNMVRLKAIVALGINTFICDFNSNMVRLKD